MEQPMKVPSMTPLICAYPECSNQIWITVQQKRELKTFNVLKYGTSSDVYCSKECQEKHLRELSEAEFLTKGTLKNREYALVIQGADVTRRHKEKEVKIIVGNLTEQRARCLYEKLVSVIPRKKRKFLTSNEVQTFLLNELPVNLKANDIGIQVTAFRTMNKTRQLFPDAVLIGNIGKKTRYIEFIK